MSLLSTPHFHFHTRQRFTQTPDQPKGALTRSLCCTHCGTSLRVPVHASNGRCGNCHRNVLLEDVVIRGDCVRNHIVTCGTILVEPSARFAGVLQASEVVIAGRVMGTVIGIERVEVTATGKVAGTVATRALQTHGRTLIDGQIHILNGERTSTATHPR